MILSDVSLRVMLQRGHLMVDPMPPDSAIQPASIDLTLGPKLRIAVRDGGYVDYDLGDRPNGLWLHQGQFALAVTREHISIPADLVGQLIGKSTCARQGLVVEAAGLLDPGYVGNPTLEIGNLSPAPVLLTAGQGICQLVVARLSTVAERPYGSAGLNSRYQHDTEPTPARRRAEVDS